MPRIKNDKKNKLIKLTFISSNKFKYMWHTKQEAESLMKTTNDGRKRDHKYEYAEWYIYMEYLIKIFFSSKFFEKIMYIFIGGVLAKVIHYFYDKWF